MKRYDEAWGDDEVIPLRELGPHVDTILNLLKAGYITEAEEAAVVLLAVCHEGGYQGGRSSR